MVIWGTSRRTQLFRSVQGCSYLHHLLNLLTTLFARIFICHSSRHFSCFIGFIKARCVLRQPVCGHGYLFILWLVTQFNCVSKLLCALYRRNNGTCFFISSILCVRTVQLAYLNNQSSAKISRGLRCDFARYEFVTVSTWFKIEYIFIKYFSASTRWPSFYKDKRLCISKCRDLTLVKYHL